MRDPAVSVVIAVCNGADYLEEALDSLFAQTFAGFEVIAVDDGSSDATPEILDRRAARDGRLRLLRHERSLGLTASLNRGLAAATAPLIARLDADDRAHPERLALQTAYMNAHPDCVMVGAAHRVIDESGRVLSTKRRAADDVAARWLLRFRPPAPHPSLMFRAELDGPVRYDEAYPVAQDYELQARLMRRGRAAVLPQPLLDYRVHGAAISATRRAEQARIGFDISAAAQRWLLGEELAERLAPLMRAYWFGEAPGDLRVALAAFDEMLAADIAAHPERRAWLGRQGAAILAVAAARARLWRRPAAMARAWRHAAPLLWRVAEDRGWLPAALGSHPRP